MVNRINRNTIESIHKDIGHLKEMKATIEPAKTDRVQAEHLQTLIDDWIEELEDQI